MVVGLRESRRLTKLAWFYTSQNYHTRHHSLCTKQTDRLYLSQYIHKYIRILPLHNEPKILFLKKRQKHLFWVNILLKMLGEKIHFYRTMQCLALSKGKINVFRNFFQWKVPERNPKSQKKFQQYTCWF